MTEISEQIEDDGVRSFVREDGALVRCCVHKNNLELVIVIFDDGGRIEIEPQFVDEQMLFDGFGPEHMPLVN